MEARQANYRWKDRHASVSVTPREDDCFDFRFMAETDADVDIDFHRPGVSQWEAERSWTIWTRFLERCGWERVNDD